MTTMMERTHRERTGCGEEACTLFWSTWSTISRACWTSTSRECVRQLSGAAERHASSTASAQSLGILLQNAPLSCGSVSHFILLNKGCQKSVCSAKAAHVLGSSCVVCHTFSLTLSRRTANLGASLGFHGIRAMSNRGVILTLRLRGSPTSPRCDLLYLRFSPVQMKALLKQLLEILAFIHENKYVHRDIKCSNLLIDNNLQLKVRRTIGGRDFVVRKLRQKVRSFAWKMRLLDFVLCLRLPNKVFGSLDFRGCR